ncbi:hypothetical protein PANDA_011909 [Ailuropoda melanoleuca]|uniref:GDP-D-mannose dehydratase n=1 Tax=Ailuropoda melanoleuca TaxID=9646 RepID=D2HKJ4_AILME|nr:hypothetical protein PANDA_011909 [Ailuropoda melanoleuca]
MPASARGQDKSLEGAGTAIGTRRAAGVLKLEKHFQAYFCLKGKKEEEEERENERKKENPRGQILTVELHYEELNQIRCRQFCDATFRSPTDPPNWQAMWLMLQNDEPEDFVIATGEVHSVREFVEKSFLHIGKTIVDGLDCRQRLQDDRPADGIQTEATKACVPAAHTHRWEGKNENEVGRCKETGKVHVTVDLKYYRPTEVGHLLSVRSSQGAVSCGTRKAGWHRDSVKVFPGLFSAQLLFVTWRHDTQEGLQCPLCFSLLGQSTATKVLTDTPSSAFLSSKTPSAYGLKTSAWKPAETYPWELLRPSFPTPQADATLTDGAASNTVAQGPGEGTENGCTGRTHGERGGLPGASVRPFSALGALVLSAFPIQPHFADLSSSSSPESAHLLTIAFP